MHRKFLPGQLLQSIPNITIAFQVPFTSTILWLCHNGSFACVPCAHSYRAFREWGLHKHTWSHQRRKPNGGRPSFCYSSLLLSCPWDPLQRMLPSIPMKFHPSSGNLLPSGNMPIDSIRIDKSCRKESSPHAKPLS